LRTPPSSPLSDGWGIPYRLLGRSAISESGFHLSKGLRRHFRVGEREVRWALKDGRRRRRAELILRAVAIRAIFVNTNIRA
jgi:hypothetical protein